MHQSDKIRSFLESAAEYPAKSKLEPYEELIRSLRQKRWKYEQIATALNTEFAVSVAPSTIHNFLKVRAKRNKEPAPEKQVLAKSSNVPPAKAPRFKVDA